MNTPHNDIVDTKLYDNVVEEIYDALTREPSWGYCYCGKKACGPHGICDDHL